MSDTPAGWNPDPEQPGQIRYWDGTQWTEHRQPAPAAAYPPPGAPYAQAYPQPGVPFVPSAPGSAPAASNSGCLKWALLALGVFLVLGVVAVVALGVVGSRVVKRVERTFGEADKSDYVATLDSCKVNSTGSVEVGGTLKNRADRRQAYSVKVSISAEGNIRIGDTTAYITKLDRDQTGTWSATDFGSVPEGKTPKCEITEVDYSI